MSENLGNKEIMAKNIKYYMEINNKDRNQICKDLDFKYSTFTDWVNGNKYPRIDKIEQLANYFNVSKSDLVEDKQFETTKYKPKKGVKIPVLGYVAAGIPIEAIEDIVDYEEIPEELAVRGEYFGLKIKGRSMEPRICEGDVVIVRQQPNVENGELAIVLVNGNDATCKKISKHENGITLISFNPTYAPMFYTNEEIQTLPVTILGKVVELRGKF